MTNITEIKLAGEIKESLQNNPIIEIPDKEVLHKIASSDDFDLLKIVKTIDSPVKIISASIVDEAMITNEF